MRLIIGLGNPGAQYERTRHNAGFDVVQLLAAQLQTPLGKLKGKAKIGEGFLEGQKFALAQPQTYMNLSGECVLALMNWYRLSLEDILVIYDDIDLPHGRVRMRLSGSAGTHNGMRSIIGTLGEQDFPRIRVGVGRPPPEWDLAHYVLAGYTQAERQTAFDAYRHAQNAAYAWLLRGPDEAMRVANAPMG